MKLVSKKLTNQVSLEIFHHNTVEKNGGGLFKLALGDNEPHRLSNICDRIAPVTVVALRIPDSYDAKIAKIGNLWTSWPVIHPIGNPFKI